MEFVRSNFIPLGLSDFIDRLRGGKPLTKQHICITFDDGYENNATVAAPILKEMGIPAIFFVTTGFLGGTTRLWVDRFETAYAVLTGKKESDAVVRSRLKQMSPNDREAYLKDIEVRTGTANTIHPLHRSMTWEQARRLLDDGFEIGAHTVTHPILGRCDPKVMVHEITESKRVIEQRCGISCPHFAHPNGQPDDWNDAVMQAIRLAGFESCLTTIRGEVRTDDDPFTLKRDTIDTGANLVKFVLTVTGVRTKLNWLRRKLRL